MSIENMAYQIFKPAGKIYCSGKKKVPIKISLHIGQYNWVTQKALMRCKRIHVFSMPANMTSILQPTDQRVIFNFQVLLLKIENFVKL